jgi:hypothetical protein
MPKASDSESESQPPAASQDESQEAHVRMMAALGLSSRTSAQQAGANEQPSPHGYPTGVRAVVAGQFRLPWLLSRVG